MKIFKTMLLGVLAVTAGCATKEMKSTPFYTGSQVTYTGRVEDRVNLWPAAYYREPVGSVAWPLLSFSDDHFALRPLYSQYKQDGRSGRYDEFNVVWPIAQFDTKHNDYRVLPFCWGDDYYALFPLLWYKTNGEFTLFPLMGYEPDRRFWLFPLVWYKPNDYFNIFPLVWYAPDDYFVVFPEFWWTKNTYAVLPFWTRRDFSAMGVFPFYWSVDKPSEKINTLFPLWWYSANGSEEARYNTTFWAAAGLTGYSTREGKYDCSWLFPLYYHDDYSFVTPLFGHDAKSDWVFPLYYHEGDEIVTPLGGKGKDYDWVFPLYYRDNHNFTSLFYLDEHDPEGNVTSWCVPPLLTFGHSNPQTGAESVGVLLGLGGHARDQKGATKSWTFPLFYWDDNLFLTALFGKTQTSDWLIPLYYHDDDIFLSSLYGRTRTSDWLIPLYYRNERSFITPLFGTVDDANWFFPLYYQNAEKFVTPLFGKSGDADWVLPLYYRNPRSFYSLLYATETDVQDRVTSWCVPPLVSFGNYDRQTGAEQVKVLAGLGGYSKNKNGASAAWTFPLFYWDDDLFLTALFGKTETADWLFPLYYHDEDNFVTLLGGKTKNADWVLPFYYRGDNGFYTLLGGGTAYKHCILPLYAKHGDDFVSLPWGRTGSGTSQTNTWWCTPLVGTKSGRQQGFWLFPLLDHEAVDSSLGDYSKLAALTKKETLPPEIVFEPKTIKQRALQLVPDGKGGNSNAWVNVSKTVLSTQARQAHEKTSLLLFSKHDKDANAQMSYNYKDFTVESSRESGNVLVVKHSKKTTATFDPQTRKRKSLVKHREFVAGLHLLASWESGSNTADGSRNWSFRLLTLLFNADNKVYKNGKTRGKVNVLGPLYNHEWKLNGDENMNIVGPLWQSEKKNGAEESSVLWRVWHREKKNGQVSIDLFPGITHDSKPDGYNQTSFLWRFFRYQNELGRGVSFDLFFLPLKRP